MRSKTDREICGTCQHWTGKREPVFTAKISETEGITNNTNLGKHYSSGLVFDVPGGDITVCLDSCSGFNKGDTVTVTGKIDTELYGDVYIDAYASNIK